MSSVSVHLLDKTFSQNVLNDNVVVLDQGSELAIVHLSCVPLSSLGIPRAESLCWPPKVVVAGSCSNELLLWQTSSHHVLVISARGFTIMGGFDSRRDVFEIRDLSQRKQQAGSRAKKCHVASTSFRIQVTSNKQVIIDNCAPPSTSSICKRWPTHDREERRGLEDEVRSQPRPRCEDYTTSRTRLL